MSENKNQLTEEEKETAMNATMEAFFERSDQVIAVANGQITEQCHLGQVGASLIYAAARFGAFSASVGFQNSEDYLSEKEKMIEFYSKQFNQMLSDNIDDYAKNFDRYAEVSKD